MTDDGKINANDVYAELHDFAQGSSLNAYVTTNEKNDYMFILEGHRSDFDNPFSTLNSVCQDYPPTEIEFSGSAGGTHILLRYKSDNITGEPQPQESYDRIQPREPETETIRECTNCKVSTHGLYRPPAKFAYPTSEHEKPRYETHDLCVNCSPGHFDDVTRKVEYFGVNQDETEICKIAFKTQDGSLDWVEMEDMDNPFIQDTIDVLNTVVLAKE